MKEFNQFILDVYYVDGSVKTLELTGLETISISNLDKFINSKLHSDKSVQTWILQPMLEKDYDSTR